MSEEKKQVRRKRKRAEWLESGIVLILTISIFVTLGLCVFLSVGLYRLDADINGLLERTDALVETVDSQREQIQELVVAGSVNAEQDFETEDVNVLEKEEEAPVEQEPESSEQVQEAKHKVYLTFDDGPSKYTPEILKILEQYEVKATFFVVGKESDSAKEYIKDIVAQGHALGMHSYSHKYGEIYSSVESFAADFDKQQQYLYKLTGKACMIYRFPGGSSNEVSSTPMNEFASYLDGRGVTFYDWNVVSGDGVTELQTVEQLVSNTMAGVGRREHSIVLFHDSADKSTTVEALPQIIENILALEDTVILPITEETVPVQHIQWKVENEADQTKE